METSHMATPMAQTGGAPSRRSGPLWRFASKIARATQWRLARYGLFRLESSMILKRETSFDSRPDAGSSLSIVQVGPEAMNVLLAWGRNPREDYQGRFDRGDVCFLGRLNGRPAGHVWLALKEWVAQECEYSMLLDGAVWVYDVFTDPACRRRGVCTELLREACAWAAQQGCQKAYVHIFLANEASLRAHQAAGFTVYEEIRYCRIGPFVWQRILGKGRRQTLLRAGPLAIRTGPASGAGAGDSVSKRSIGSR